MRVLVVCSMGYCRSPLAAHYLNEQGIPASSAGTRPAKLPGACPQGLGKADDSGAWATHEPAGVNKAIGFDLILAMDAAHYLHMSRLDTVDPDSLFLWRSFARDGFKVKDMDRMDKVLDPHDRTNGQTHAALLAHLKTEAFDIAQHISSMTSEGEN